MNSPYIIIIIFFNIKMKSMLRTHLFNLNGLILILKTVLKSSIRAHFIFNNLNKMQAGSITIKYKIFKYSF